MKKIILLLIAFFLCLEVTASDFKSLPYKNIKQNGSITYVNDGWIKKAKKDGLSFKRQANSFYSKNGMEFDTESDYVFVKDGRLIGYSSSDLKFYEFVFNEDHVIRQALSYDETAQLFKNYKIILISEFSESTNSIKFKKRRANKKLMIINDTDLKFDNYEFTSNNAKFKKYNVNNVIELHKKGLIQFASSESDDKNSPWFIILIR